MKLILTLLTLLVLVACHRPYVGELTSFQNFKFDGKDDKVLGIAQGTTRATLSFVSKDVLKLKLRGNQNGSVKFEIPVRADRLPKNGIKLLRAEDLNQDFDLLLDIKTTEYASETKSKTKSCGDGGTQRVVFHYEHEDSTLAVDFLDIEDEKLIIAQFEGKYNKKTEVIDSKGPCRGENSNSVSDDKDNDDQNDDSDDDQNDDSDDNDDCGHHHGNGPNNGNGHDKGHGKGHDKEHGNNGKGHDKGKGHNK